VDARDAYRCAVRVTWQVFLAGTTALLTGVLIAAPAMASPRAVVFGADGAVSPGSVVTPSSSAAGTSTAGSGSVSSQAYADNGVLTFGDASYFGAPTDGAPLASPVVAMAATPDGGGYWLTGADGGIFSYGDAKFHGSAGAINLNAPIIGMSATTDGAGYWQVAVDGGVFTYGDAGFYGSTGNLVLNQPIVGMAPTPDGKGYWLVASDGGIFAFGDAGFYGSTGNLTLNSPIVGMASTKDGKGYWLVAADGGIFAFGDASFYGSLGSDDNLPAAIVGMATTPDGGGYWLAGSGGGVYAFGDATYYGESSAIQPTEVIAGIAPTPDGKGYWLLEPDAFPMAFDHPGPTTDLGGSVVADAAGQIEGDPDTGYFCNPYGPCEEWCALFATWVWETAGIDIPRYAFVGDAYNWAADNTAVLAPTATPTPGDMIFYGTGPENVDTAVHMGIVAQVWPDGEIVTVEGDAGPAPEGHFNVIMNGPFLPSESPQYNGFPVFGYGVP
jgi:hypothetical protein